MARLSVAATLLVLAACENQQQPLAPSSAGALALEALGASVASANATVTDLGGLPGYTGAVALAINASGRAVGSAGNFGFGEVVVAVSFDPPTLLFRDENYPFDYAAVAYGINDAGVISGAGLKDFGDRPFIGPPFDPFPTWLPPLQGAFRHLNGFYINNAGEVAGSSWFDPRPITPPHGTVWVPGPSGYTPVDLGTFNGHGIEVFGIAPNLSGESRIIVGRYAPADEFSTFYSPLVWQNGAWTELPAPPGCLADRNIGQANAASDDGRIVGSGCVGAALWENGTVQDLHPQCQALFTASQGGSHASGIAVIPSVPRRTLIVGRCILMPVVWYDDGAGGYTAELLPLLEGDTEGEAYDVNSAGQIVGFTSKSVFSTDPTAHAVLWTYTPPPLEPSDLAPPVITVPADMTVEATSAAGAVVSYTASATDNVDPSPVVQCVPPSGTTFPLGSTVVTCTATDAAGNTATASFVVTVDDTTLPVLSLPADFAVDATSPSGAVVSYTVSASDAASVPTVSCTPASGSLFAIGKHTVSCTATDAIGNSSTGSFLVTVKGAEEQITDLQGAVAGLDLEQGIETSLEEKLAAASSSVALGERDDACGLLQALINQVNAQSGKKINAVDAAVLIAEAERIRTVLGC